MSAPRILIVEDEAILANGLERALKKNGYVPIGTAGSGEEALALAEAANPDLILMDIRLRGEMDGIATAEQIRARAEIPVIYLTAYADQETLQRAKITTPHGYLVKPYDERLLIITVEMALAKHSAEKALRSTMEELDRVNRELERQKRFFEALFRAIPSAVLVVNIENRVRAANPFLKKMLGIASEGVVGRSSGEALCCAVAPREGHACGRTDCAETCSIHHCIREAFEGQLVQRAKVSFGVSSGGVRRDLSLLLSTAVIEFDEERLCILILEDVTELDSLRRIVQSSHSFAGIVGGNERMQEVYATIREVADSSVPVLIQGESGTGKELVALAIHHEGSRSRRHFVAVNCGALPDGLLESELFGHVKGSFTGAIRDKKGRFELADGGTLFLDEIGELTQAMQVKLLRVLQNGAFERVGGEQTVRVDVRIVAATNKDLFKEASAGRFRKDLFYRLAVVPIHMPPLRERREDIPYLAEHLLLRIAHERGSKEASLSAEALGRLLAYPWPGNVRELENALQYALLKSRGGSVGLEHLPPSIQSRPAAQAAANRHARKLRAPDVIEALKACGGNKLKAAQLLGVSRATLYRHLDENPSNGAGS